MNKVESRWLQNFVDAILSLETEEECIKFFEDICTIKEFQDLAHRLEVARLLTDGKVFNELVRGKDSRREFFNRIIEVVTLLGGDVENVF